MTAKAPSSRFVCALYCLFGLLVACDDTTLVLPDGGVGDRSVADTQSPDDGGTSGATSDTSTPLDAVQDRAETGDSDVGDALSDAVATPDPQHCFVSSDMNSVPFRSLVQAPPPLTIDGSTYLDSSPHYPSNVFTSTALNRLDRSLPPFVGVEIEQAPFVWVDRCHNIDGPPTTACPGTVRKGNYYRLTAPTTHPAVVAEHLPPSGIGILRVPIPGMGSQTAELRPIFSSVLNAERCTRIKLAHVLGNPRSRLDAIARDDIEIRTEAEILSQYDRLAEFRQYVPGGSWYGYFPNICIIEDTSSLGPINGVVLDWEVHDKRPPERSARLIELLADLADEKSIGLTFYTNSVATAATRRDNGIDHRDPFRMIFARFDAFAPILWSGATPGNPDRFLPGTDRRHSTIQDLDRTIAIVSEYSASRTVDYSKFEPAVSLYQGRLTRTSDGAAEMTGAEYIREAEQLHHRALRDGYRGLSLWRNFQQPGCGCDRPVNQFLACLLMGECDGGFGGDRLPRATTCDR